MLSVVRHDQESHLVHDAPSQLVVRGEQTVALEQDVWVVPVSTFNQGLKQQVRGMHVDGAPEALGDCECERRRRLGRNPSGVTLRNLQLLMIPPHIGPVGAHKFVQHLAAAVIHPTISDKEGSSRPCAFAAGPVDHSEQSQLNLSAQAWLQHRLAPQLAVRRTIGLTTVKGATSINLGAFAASLNPCVPFLEVSMKARDDNSAVVVVLVIQAEAAAQEAAVMSVIQVPIRVQVQVQEAGALPELGGLGHVWVTDQAPVLIGVGGGGEGIQDHIVAKQLLLQAVEHVPLKAHASSAGSDRAVMSVHGEAVVQVSTDVLSVPKDPRDVDGLIALVLLSAAWPCEPVEDSLEVDLKQCVSGQLSGPILIMHQVPIAVVVIAVAADGNTVFLLDGLKKGVWVGDHVQE